jgi:hypothetical protein
MSKKRKNRKNHMGSSTDDFLKEEGIFEEAQAQAVKEVVAWQLDHAMRSRKYPRTKWPPCSRPAAPKLTGSLIRKTTSRFPACNARRRWSDAA